jgi:hypothetical protein
MHNCNPRYSRDRSSRISTKGPPRQIKRPYLKKAKRLKRWLKWKSKHKSLGSIHQKEEKIQI